MSRLKTGLIVLLILTLLLVAFIWGNSLLDAARSSVQSGWVTEHLKPFLELFVGKGNAGDMLVRKLAHFSEYYALGFLLPLTLKAIFKHPAARFLALPLGFGVAMADEFIFQKLSAGRVAQMSDVVLDSIGFGLGFLLVMTFVLVLWIDRYRRQKLD